MAAAQFGHSLFAPGARFGQTVFQLFAPEWHIPRAGYIPAQFEEGWQAVPYPFGR